MLETVVGWLTSDSGFFRDAWPLTRAALRCCLDRQPDFFDAMKDLDSANKDTLDEWLYWSQFQERPELKPAKLRRVAEACN